MKQEKRHPSTVSFAIEEDQGGDDDNSEATCPAFMYMGGHYDSMALNAKRCATKSLHHTNTTDASDHHQGYNCNDNTDD